MSPPRLDAERRVASGGRLGLLAGALALLALAGSTPWSRAARANPIYDASLGAYVTGDGGGLTVWRMQGGRVEEAVTYTLITPSTKSSSRYETWNKQVLVSPAGKRRVEVPAVVDGSGKVLVPAHVRDEDIPAEYETRTAQVLVGCSQTEWDWDAAYVLRKAIQPGARPVRPAVDPFVRAAPSAGGSACGAGGTACGK